MSPATIWLCSEGYTDILFTVQDTLYTAYLSLVCNNKPINLLLWF